MQRYNWFLTGIYIEINVVRSSKKKTISLESMSNNIIKIPLLKVRRVCDDVHSGDISWIIVSF